MTCRDRRDLGMTERPRGAREAAVVDDLGEVVEALEWLHRWFDPY